MAVPINKKRIILLFIFVMASAHLLVDHFTNVEINSDLIFYFLVFAATSSLGVMTCLYLFGGISNRVALLIIVSVFAGCFMSAASSWQSSWKTQTLIYRNLKHPKQTIEFRMRITRSPYRYERQIVIRRRIMPNMDYIIAIDTAALDKSKWVYVNERKNEMGIPSDYVDLPFN